MPSRAPRGPVALLLAGVLVLFVGVIAQLSVTDGAAEVLWVLVSVAGALLVVAGVVLLVRGRGAPPED